MQRLDDRSRMSGDVHVRFRERLEGRFLWATRLVVCFQYPDDAQAFMEQLEQRLEKFGLKLAMEKTRCIKFGRFARGDANRRGERARARAHGGGAVAGIARLTRQCRPIETQGMMRSAKWNPNFCMPSRR